MAGLGYRASRARYEKAAEDRHLAERRVKEVVKETELKEFIIRLESRLSVYDFLSDNYLDGYDFKPYNFVIYREGVIDDKGYTKLCQWIQNHQFEVSEILPPGDTFIETLKSCHGYNFSFTLNDVVLDIDDLCKYLKDYIDPHLNYPKPKPAESNWTDRLKFKSTIEEKKKEMYRKEMIDKREAYRAKNINTFNIKVFDSKYSKKGGYTGYKSEEILSQLVDKYTKTFNETHPETDSNIVSQTIKTRMREFALRAIDKIRLYIIECFELLCEFVDKIQEVSRHWDLTDPDRYKLIDKSESLPSVMRVMLTKHELIKSEQAVTVTKGGSNRKKTKTIRKKTRTRKGHCNRSHKCRIRSRNSKKSYTI